jgi:cysteine synthase B
MFGQSQAAYSTLSNGVNSLLAEVGNTPLIDLSFLTSRKLGVRVFGKTDWLNPTGSVKDRSALSIISAAERAGQLTSSKTILDATSGNAGIAYAMIGASKGYRVMLTIPKNANEERKRILRAYGVQLVYTDPLEGSDGAIRKAREIYSGNPPRYFYADQYSNDANWRAHYDTTGPEIWSQTSGSITHFVAGVGTGGTLMGVGRRLRGYNRRIQIVSVQPDSPFHGIEGLKHIPTSILPKIYDPTFPDRVVQVATEEAQQLVKQLANEHGILVGLSSGAALAASRKIASEIEGGTVVAILPDSGERYLSEKFWEDS